MPSVRPFHSRLHGPNTTDNRVQQMIDRGAGNDAQWLGSNLDLLTDFIGIDTRTG